ncbi:MAG: tRNA dihydrouridine synthase DusB [Treponema sp.]|jgi:nifR3 family TIM-barrel protein|nr:tRNA dihydrouridine synthase DusB [Treponema sp.]
MDLYHPLNIGRLQLSGNLFLAPVAGYTDRAFRSICAEAGAVLSFTELISAEALSRLALSGKGETGALKDEEGFPPIARRGKKEGRCGIQLFGADPAVLGRVCALLAPLRPDVVDLNAGCPVLKVIKTGAGSALMRDPSRLGRAVEAMAAAARETLGGVPVTVKLRSGWDAASLNYAECARIAVEAGAAMVSIHPRTRAQGYAGKSDWSLIADLAGRLPVPVAGSGDLHTPEDARRMLAETGCAAVMFARGAMGNPFIFSAARALLSGVSWKTPEAPERIAAALRHLEMLAEDIGEKRACLEMRKQFCAYTRGVMGLPGISRGAALREKLVRAGTIAQYREILAYYM